MATTTLTNGTKIPERASRDWYSDLSTNWYLLDNHLGDTDSHLDNGLAPKATSDADGNTITSTYATKTELSTLSNTVGTKANDSDVVHKADAETITGAKTFSATVTSADVVPSTTDTYSLGSASYQYNAVYGKSYFYNGTQWGLDVANTWTQMQTFNNQIRQVMDVSSTETPSANVSNYYNIVGNNSGSLFLLTYIARPSGQRDANLRVYSADGSYNGWMMGKNSSGGFFMPIFTDTVDLGTSSSKWKTLNGINPGALSLPSTSSTDIKSYITSGTAYDYIAPLDGWVCVGATNCTNISLQNRSKTYFRQRIANSSALDAVFLFIPCQTGDTVRIEVTGTIDSARFHPCLGNV